MVMANKIKKTLSFLIAAATLSTCGIAEISASGVSETVYFHTNVGAPSSATHISHTWEYSTALSTTTINVYDFSASIFGTHIMAYISVDNVTRASGNIYPTGGTISANELLIGRPACGYAEVSTSSGNTYAVVSISG